MARTKLEVALPRRWSHVQAVAAKARRIAAAVPQEDRDILVAAAWLHDVSGWGTKTRPWSCRRMGT
ncbi:HD domain-containing protein [Micromonospora sp. NPDC000668]|uniref:HD domain-containing protein n=1 Tax=Micromonospora sp. NPDC000668 TaxID=3364219 RepID=UPI0036B4EDF3